MKRSMSSKVFLIRNFAAGAAGQAINICLRLLQVPIFIHFLGIERYGQWMIVYSVPSLLLLGNPGFGAATANKIALDAAAGNINEASESYSSGLLAIATFCAVVTAASFLLVYVLPWGWLLKTPNDGGLEPRGALFLLSIAVLATLPTDLFAGCFRAARKADTAIYIAAIRPLLELALIIVVIQISTNFLALAGSVLLSSITYLAIFFMMSRRVLPDIKYKINSVSIRQIKYLLAKGTSFQGLAIGNALMLQGSLLAVQSALGPAAVVIFSTARTMVGAVLQAMGMLNNATWPEFSMLIGKGDLEKAARLHRVTSLLTLLIGLSGTIFLMIFGKTLFDIWTNDRIEMPRTLFWTFILPIPLTALYASSAVIHAASNKHEGMALLQMIGSLLSAISCYFLAQRFGLYGAATAMTLMNIISMHFIFSRALVMSGDTPVRFFHGCRDEIHSFINFIAARVKG